MKKDKLKKRWAILGVIWTIVLIFTYWNADKIDAIIRDRKANEIFRQDEKFWKYNSKNIYRILENKKLLSQPVESLKIGLLSVENDLKLLASKYDFYGLKIESSIGKASNGRMPINLVFYGSLEKALHWLRAVQDNYPYIPVGRIKISFNQGAKRAECHILLYYRYEISSPKDMV